MTNEPVPPSGPRSAPAVSRLITAWARGVVRLILRAHPRAFRRRFEGDVLVEVDHDLQEAATGGSRRASRAAASAIVDAVAGLGAARGGHSADVHDFDLFPERPRMRNWWHDIVTDLRLSVRSFRHAPGWCAAVIVTLALGIGVNAAMFGVADRLLLSGPEHIHDAARVRRVQLTWQPPGRDVQHDGIFPYAAYAAFRRGSHTTEGVAAYSSYPDMTVIGRGVDARRINRGEATANFFPLLGVTPTLGRFFADAEDDTVSPQRVVVIGYELWQSDFGGRSDVLGQSILLDNTTYSVIGVTPRGFTGPDLMRVDVWYPESIVGRDRIRPNWTQGWNSIWLSIVVRVRPEVSDDQVDQELTSLYRSAVPASGNTLGGREAASTASFAVRPLTYDQDGVESMEARISTWLAAVAGIVLVVACANVVNLVLARGLQRRREIAVRLALGAGRTRLVRLLVVEALVLAGAGGTAGLAVAYLFGTLMRKWLLPTVTWPNGPIGGRVLVVSAVVSLATGLFVGLVPAWRASSPNVSADLKAGVREGRGRRQRTRAALTILQAALCALLLVGSGLFVVSLHRVRGMDLGLQPDRILTFGVRRAGIPSTESDEATKLEQKRRDAFYPMVLERLQTRPDVESAALTIGLAFWNGFGEDIRVPGLDHIPALKGGGPFLSAVTADYFRTVGTRILRGRAFTTADHDGTAPVAIVSETMARTLWPGQDAIGKCFIIEDNTACTDIVGIAADARHFKLRENDSLTYYIPFGQERHIGGTTLIVRPRGDAAPVLAAVRQQIMSLDPSVTYVDARLLQDLVEPQIRPWELGATMFSLMGVLALVVAAVGLYSLMSYLVTDRAHEIGVRLALGARPADVARLVVRGGLTLALGGIGLGFGFAILAGQLVQPLLFETSARTPSVFAEVAATLVTMAIVATILPAARAGRVNPVEAMRVE